MAGKRISAWTAGLVLLAVPALARQAGGTLQERLEDELFRAGLHRTRRTTLAQALCATALLELSRYVKPKNRDRELDLELFRRILRRKIAHFRIYGRPEERRIPGSLPSEELFRLSGCLPEGERVRFVIERFAAARLPRVSNWSRGEICAFEAQLERLRGAAAGWRGPREGIERRLDRLARDLKAITPGRRAPAAPRPGRRERYEYVLQHVLFVDHTPRSLLEFGIKRYEAVKRRMAEVAKRIDPRADWPTLIERAKTRCFRVQTLHKESAELARRARAFVVDRGLATVPEADFAVRRAPPDSITPFGFYAPGGPGRKGTYMTAPVSGEMPDDELRQRLRGNHRLWTAIVALHETVPGHHLQHEVERRLKRPRIRTVLRPPTYVEGWGLYCEEMMFRAGYFGDEPLFELVLLQMRLWRCARVILDVGLHVGSLSPEAAASLLIDGVRLEPVCAKLEVEHYMRRPGYFSSYLLGLDRFMHLRTLCEQKLGKAFDLRAFHDRILTLGPLPMDLLEKEVLHWAEESSAGPSESVEKGAQGQ